MTAIWFHQPQSRRGRQFLGYAVEVTVLTLRPHTARIAYRRWDGKLISRFVKRARLHIKEVTHA